MAKPESETGCIRHMKVFHTPTVRQFEKRYKILEKHIVYRLFTSIWRWWSVHSLFKILKLRTTQYCIQTKRVTSRWDLLLEFHRSQTLQKPVRQIVKYKWRAKHLLCIFNVCANSTWFSSSASALRDGLVIDIEHIITVEATGKSLLLSMDAHKTVRSDAYKKNAKHEQKWNVCVAYAHLVK